MSAPGAPAAAAAPAARSSSGSIDAGTLIRLLNSTPGVPDLSPLLAAYKAGQVDKTQLIAQLKAQVGVEALREALNKARPQPPAPAPGAAAQLAATAGGAALLAQQQQRSLAIGLAAPRVAPSVMPGGRGGHAMPAVPIAPRAPGALPALPALPPLPPALPALPELPPLPTLGGTKRSAPGADGRESPAKRVRTLANSPAGGASSPQHRGLAAADPPAAAAADDGAGGDGKGDGKGDGGKKKETLEQDVLAQSGIDMQAEEEAHELPPAASRDDVDVLAPLFLAEQIQSKLGTFARAFSLEKGVADGAGTLMAHALEERLRNVVEKLAPIAAHRQGDLSREMFGKGGTVVTHDPKKPWRLQPPKRENYHRTDGGGGGGGGSGGGGAEPMAAADQDDARRLAQISAGGDAAAAASSRPPQQVTAADVLHLLENEPQSCKSRIVQWWHCENKPLKRYARLAARVHRPPADGGK